MSHKLPLERRNRLNVSRSLQRVEHYISLSQDAQEAEGTEAADGWPSSGLVEFEAVSARYARHLDFVLQGLSFKALPLERVGIVGRTGAGKSTLALMLLRGLEVERGWILIDGIDIRSTNLQALRRRLAYVPQGPTLFTGTLRQNLDPFDEHSDEEILEAHSRVGLVVPKRSRTEAGSAYSSGEDGRFVDLSFTVTDAGSNMSQGQRQLVCVARAILRRSKTIILDEATASIDHDSDFRIQACIRELDATVITIAHRLRTVVEYDRIIGLENGHAVEDDHPWCLLQCENGIFKSMCEAAADREELIALAKAAWDSK